MDILIQIQKTTQELRDEYTNYVEDLEIMIERGKKSY